MNATTTMLSAPWAAPAEAAASRLDLPVRTAQVALPDAPSGWRHAWLRWRTMLGGALRGHRLRPHEARHYSAVFKLDEPARGRWHDLYGHSARRAEDAPCSFLYGQGAAMLLAARLAADVGVQPRHVLHLRHQTWHPHGANACNAAPRQQLQCRLKRAVRVGHAAALLVVETEYADAIGRVVALVEDSFIVRRLGVAEVVNAENDTILRRAVASLRRRGPELSPHDAGVHVATWTIDARDVRGFTRLAGDLDPANTLAFARPRPHVPCMHLRNLVARELSRLGIAAPRLAITFVGKARAGRVLQLVLHDERFEISDTAGRLVAFGNL